MFSRWLRAVGIDWACFHTGMKGLQRFWSDYRQVTKLNSAVGNPRKIQASYPCLHDFYGQSGVARVERIEQCHRVFDLRTLLALIERSLEIVEFSMVDDAEELRVNQYGSAVRRSTRYQFAPAIFELRKREQ